MRLRTARLARSQFTFDSLGVGKCRFIDLHLSKHSVFRRILGVWHRGDGRLFDRPANTEIDVEEFRTQDAVGDEWDRQECAECIDNFS